MTAPPTTSCRHTAASRAVFQFPAGGGATLCCWRCALGYRPMLRRSGRIAFVVGTILALINHGDHLIGGEATASVGLKIALTYLVPFGVATWSALVNGRVGKVS